MRFDRNGLDRFVFVGGYLMDVVRDAYPNLTYVENPAWSTTNILASLVCAREHMSRGFYATYTDTLYRERRREGASGFATRHYACHGHSLA